MVADKKKVLMVSCFDLENGGVQNVIMGIVRGIEKDVIVDIILFSKDESYYDKEFLSYGGKIFNLPHLCCKSNIINRLEIYFRWIKNYPKVKKIIKSNGPYIAVHCHNDIESGYILKAAKKCNVSVRISHVHRIVGCMPGLRHVFQKVWVSTMKKNATHLLSCSKEAGKDFFQETQFSVINNPYNEKRFQKNIIDKKESYPFILLQVASYSERKNQLFTIEVFSKIKKIIPEAELHFVGFEATGHYQSEMQKIIKILHLEDNVFMFPSDADVPYLLRRASYFMLPSREEAFGLVLIEAQAMGVRCFASDAVPEETDCGGCTYLPLSLGAENWAKIIAEDYERTKGAHGEFDCSRFESKHVAEEFRKIYECE